MFKFVILTCFDFCRSNSPHVLLADLLPVSGGRGVVWHLPWHLPGTTAGTCGMRGPAHIHRGGRKLEKPIAMHQHTRVMVSDLHHYTSL